jgi:ribosome biogenesis GTPase
VSPAGPDDTTSAYSGRIIRAQSGFYTVQTPSGPVTAVLRGRLKKERQEAGLAALGDIVSVQPVGRCDGEAGPPTGVITTVQPRRSALARRAPGPKGVWSQDVIVANIDQLVIVFAVADPSPHLRLLDRFLAIAEMNELDSVIVLNKVDLGVPPALAAALAEYARIGYPVVQTSVETSEGVSQLRELLGDRLSAVVGASGVGKSSLLNAVEPGLGLRVGHVSTAVHKGRHTTRVGELFPLAGGGLVADTPGVREMGIWEVDPGELEWAFVEFRPFLHTCKFHNCNHDREPGCAVRAAVENGAISTERYESYLRLLEEP